MTHDAILTAIYTKVGTITGIPTMRYPNVSYDDQPDEYCRVFVLPAQTLTETIDDYAYFSGLIQINVMTKENIGEIKCAEYAQTIMSAFKRGTIISGDLKVKSHPYASSGTNLGSYKSTDFGGYYMMAVSIPYWVIGKA